MVSDEESDRFRVEAARVLEAIGTDFQDPRNPLEGAPDHRQLAGHVDQTRARQDLLGRGGPGTRNPPRPTPAGRSGSRKGNECPQ
jgi:hypothetical protein